MSPSVQRHTQMRADRLKSGTISAAEAKRVFEVHSIGSAALGTIMPDFNETGRMIGTHRIESDLLSYLVQSGSARIGTTRYISFPTSFAVTPTVTLTRLGSWDYTAGAGSVAELTVMTCVSGSFSAHGTPTQAYVLWIAHGSA